MPYGKPFCSGKFSLVHVHWNDRDHLWKSVQESFQVKWLLKFLSMSELKLFIFKILNSKKLEASSFNNIKWIEFYHLIELHFCMGQNTGYFNKANQRYSFFLFSFKKIASKIDKHIMLTYLLLYNKHLDWFFLTPSKIPTCTSQANLLKICYICILPQRKT